MGIAQMGTALTGIAQMGTALTGIAQMGTAQVGLRKCLCAKWASPDARIAGEEVDGAGEKGVRLKFNNFCYFPNNFLGFLLR